MTAGLRAVDGTRGQVLVGHEAKPGHEGTEVQEYRDSVAVVAGNHSFLLRKLAVAEITEGEKTHEHSDQLATADQTSASRPNTRGGSTLS